MQEQISSTVWFQLVTTNIQMERTMARTDKSLNKKSIHRKNEMEHSGERFPLFSFSLAFSLACRIWMEIYSVSPSLAHPATPTLVHFSASFQPTLLTYHSAFIYGLTAISKGKKSRKEIKQNIFNLQPYLSQTYISRETKVHFSN